MSAPGPEDRLWPELYDAARGKAPRHDEWTRQMSFGSAIRGGGSGNWPWLANAIAAWRGDIGVLNTVALATERSNDWNLNEPLADDSHDSYILVGKTLLRDALVRGPVTDVRLANRLTQELRQHWAMLTICATSPLDPLLTWIVPPGARASAPQSDRAKREYLFMRAAGYSYESIKRHAVDGAGICRRADRIMEHKEVSLRDVFDLAVESMATDLGPVLDALVEHGWDGLVPFLRFGTRVPFEFVRTAFGFTAVMERNCNANNGPRWAVIGGHGRVPCPVQFPTKAVARQQFEEGLAQIRPAARRVVVESETSGSFEHPISGGLVDLWLRCDAMGWHVIEGGFEEEPDTPLPPPDPPIETDDDPPPPPAGEPRERDRFDARIVVACIVAVIVIGIIARSCGG